ncbi:tyrosine-protein phosphatase non-receptor type 18 isoform X2 [Octodon degus]|uniref:protein-tyrosine-phosphatase n=1 Tax=Octodon degus TaxID=10160 RepID=A0A6P3FCT6_OCTDE|nr:tyrosine-protein phosphatase non-receptor type 18 isoform X2 [Octodon degus]
MAARQVSFIVTDCHYLLTVDIRACSAAWRTNNVCSAEAGSLPSNVRKNRYKDVVAYDQTRVILSLLQEEGHGDYINGNFIRGADGSQAYIATQGPLPHTLLDFWRLVWEFGVKVILMACRETENGRKKCERYWPQEKKPLQIGPFCITLTKEAALNADVILRTLAVSFQKEFRSVHQLQYMSWPDRGVPSNPDTVLTMIEEARRLHGPSPRPLCVHCSAGCGRTGVLCTIDYVRQLLLTQTIPASFSLCDLVLEMRTQRPSFVQTEEQYGFLHHTVAQMLHSALQRTSPLCQNLKENCAPLYDDALSLRTSPALPASPCPPGRVLRSSSMPATQSLAMADTYAVVHRRGTPATAREKSERPAVETPLYSQVAPRAQQPGAHPEQAQGARPSSCPADQSPTGPDAYEDVADRAQTGGLGFNLRIGRPKGPRNPPAEWTRL